jgi:alkanesulfonate monooxygenase SsuD/methylene tetrahydromethanopterin reductase-like flavin-dependent oxidoreductase (luciferase family)
MDFGYFAMPSQPPERGLKQSFNWDLQAIRWLDELGYSEAWIGEHHTVPWEPMPAPDLLIAQALMQTSRIRLGPGGFLLPFHHPAEVANRVALLDHISEGRLNLGSSASSIPTDQVMFHVDGHSGENRAMASQSLPASSQAPAAAASADRHHCTEAWIRESEAGRRARLSTNEPHLQSLDRLRGGYRPWKAHAFAQGLANRTRSICR